jgi:hypothetical protein
VLHQRDWIEAGALRLRTSYPVLPWIGVIALGYLMGPWFARARAGAAPALAAVGRRRRAGPVRAAAVRQPVWGCSLAYQTTTLRTWLSIFNVTKYPPSLQFLLLTLGVGLLLLRLYEWPPLARALRPLADIGAAPMFFYLLHLYVLKGCTWPRWRPGGRPMANCMPWIRSAACCWWPVRWRWCCTRRRGPSRGSKREGAIWRGCDTCERWPPGSAIPAWRGSTGGCLPRPRGL